MPESERIDECYMVELDVFCCVLFVRAVMGWLAGWLLTKRYEWRINDCSHTVHRLLNINSAGRWNGVLYDYFKLADCV